MVKLKKKALFKSTGVELRLIYVNLLFTSEVHLRKKGKTQKRYFFLENVVTKKLFTLRIKLCKLTFISSFRPTPILTEITSFLSELSRYWNNE